MRLFIKIFLFLVFILVAAISAIPFFVNPNDYKDEIASQVEQATGRTLTLEGDIGLSVFPWVALELGPLSLSNAEGFKAKTFAEVNAAEIRIKLMPLFNKQLEMDTVLLDGLSLNLETKKDGTTNWDDLAKSDKTESNKDDEPTVSDDAPALAAISIAGVQLSNTHVSWDDASNGQSVKLSNLNLNTDPLIPGEPTALNVNFDIESAAPAAKAHIDLKTKVMVDMENQQYALSGLTFATQASGKDIPIETADISLSGDINANMVKQLVDISNLELTAKAVNGEQKVDANLSGQVSSNLANQQSQISDLKLTADIVDPALPTGSVNFSLAASLAADMKQQTASISALTVEVLDLLLKGEVSASKLLSEQPNIAGKINVDAFNLKQLANKLAIELPAMADDNTLQLVQVDTEFAATTNSFNAKSLSLTLDQSKLTGQLGVSNFVQPAINFKLALDEIDADRYLPPAAETTTEQAPTEASSADFPLEPLRQLNAKGVLDIGKLKISNTHSENIHIELNAAKGDIKLSPMSANMYNGSYKGNVYLNAADNTLKLAINETLKGVQAGPLLKDLSGDDKISGTANAQVKLTGNGLNVDQIKQTLSGSGNFSFVDGAVKGVNIGESIRKAKAALKGEKLAESNEPVQTDFASLTGSFTAKNGLIDNKDLAAKSPLLRLNGAGKIDLPKEGIDYALKVSVVETSKGQGGKELDDLKGLTIPVKISGTFQNPKPTVDLGSLLKDKAKEEVKAKVKDKLKDKLGGELGGLLGGATESSNTSEEADAPQKEEPKKLEDAVKDKLKGFF
jgi:AsmA protein